MKFLEKIGIGKKKKDEEELVAQPSKTSRIANVIKTLNQPMIGGIGFNPNPKRSPVEKQLGIPEFVSPLDRARDFTTTPKPIPKSKQSTKKWRPRPGVPFKDGKPW